MKKILLIAIIALFAVSTGSAQEKGHWGIGPKLGLYTNTGDAVVGIGAIARYSFTDNWRIEPAIAALLHKGCSIDLSVDVHYVFDLGKGWSIYPLAGLTANEIGEWAVGLDLGGAFDYQVARNWDITAGLKWQAMFDDSRSNPVLIHVGAIYKF